MRTSANHEPRPEYRSRKKGMPEPRLNVAQWDRLEATPYGRLGKVVPAIDMPPYQLVNRVITDQWEPPSGAAVLLKEVPRGKHCFPPRISIAGVDV